MHAWLHQFDQHFPVRYAAWVLSAVGLLLFSFTFVAFDTYGLAALVCLFLVLLGFWLAHFLYKRKIFLRL